MRLTEKCPICDKILQITSIEKFGDTKLLTTKCHHLLTEAAAYIQYTAEILISEPLQNCFKTDPSAILIPAKRPRVVPVLTPSLPIAILSCQLVLFPHATTSTRSQTE